MKNSLNCFSSKKWDCDLITVKNPEELKKVCNTILDTEGTLTLKEKLEDFRNFIIDIYDIAADLRLRELFGQEFIDDNQYLINSLYYLHTELKTQEQKCKYLCGVYEQWIMQFKHIFPKY